MKWVYLQKPNQKTKLLIFIDRQNWKILKNSAPKCIGIPIIIIGFLRKFLLRPKIYWICYKRRRAFRRHSFQIRKPGRQDGRIPFLSWIYKIWFGQGDKGRDDGNSLRSYYPRRRVALVKRYDGEFPKNIFKEFWNIWILPRNIFGKSLIPIDRHIFGKKLMANGN